MRSRGDPSASETEFFHSFAGRHSPLGSGEPQRVVSFSGATDLPQGHLTKSEPAINLKTASALRLTIPPSVLSRASQMTQ